MTRLIRYFFVGGTAAVVDFSVFAFLVQVIHWPWYISATASFVLAAATNYALSIHFVFKSGNRFKKPMEIVLVFLVSGIGLIINQISLYGFALLLGMNLYLGKVLATGIVFFWNFFARHSFVFGDALEKAVP